MLPARRTSDGALYVTTVAPSAADNFVNGVCLTNDGVLKVNANAPQKFSQGHGFLNNGAFCIDVLGSPVANYINGLPVTASGALKCQLNQPVSPGDSYIGGIRVGPLGGVYIVDTTPPANDPWSDGFSSGFGNGP